MKIPTGDLTYVTLVDEYDEDDEDDEDDDVGDQVTNELKIFL